MGHPSSTQGDRGQAGDLLQKEQTGGPDRGSEAGVPWRRATGRDTAGAALEPGLSKNEGG